MIRGVAQIQRQETKGDLEGKEVTKKKKWQEEERK